MLFISGHFNPPKQQKRRRVGIHAHRNGQKPFRQPENVINPRGQQVAHPTQLKNNATLI